MTVVTPTVQTQYTPGLQMANAKEIADSLFGLKNLNAQYGLTAQADATQAAATQLINGVNEIATVAGANDSVKLPPNSPGSVVFVANNGAQTTKVFAYEATGTVPTIDGTAGTTGVDLATAKNAWYVNVGNNKWESILTA